MLRRIAVAAALVFSTALSTPAFAQGPDIDAIFTAAKTADRAVLIEKANTASASDTSAQFAVGTAQFAMAVETFAQSMHRHGFETPRSMMLPLLRLPVPANARPEPLTYEKWRSILEKLIADLETANTTLGAVPVDSNPAFVIDLAKLRLDLNADGALKEDEAIAAIFASLARPVDFGVSDQNAAPTMPPSIPFRLDRADAYWLQGYANFLMANAKFWLAHDHRALFDNSFQLFFPKAGLPLQEVTELPEMPPLPFEGKRYEELTDDQKAQWQEAQLQRQIFNEAWIFDLVSFIHLINWPVENPQYRAEVRGHFKEMIRLSRENWKAIEAETDNDREWLPGPQQQGTHPLTSIQVTEETVAGWRNALSLFEDVLDGRALIPHPRFPGRGIDLKKFFDEPQAFDLVLTITGPGVVPYLAKGKILSGEDWRAVVNQVGRNDFLGIALWFN